MRIIYFLLMFFAVYANAAPLSCLIEPGKIAEVGSPVVGIVDSISVERGDVVKKGAVIAFLKADTEQASEEVATARAHAKAERQGAIAESKLTQLKKKRAEDLFKIGFISKQALEQAEIENDIAQSRVMQSDENQRIAYKELTLSQSQSSQRRILSPFSGMIVDRFRNEGERVEREPIVRIAQIDPLHVETILSASQFGQIKIGMIATIKTEIAGVEKLSARVVLIDRIIDAASNTFRVRLSLPNPNNRIPAGLRCTAEFDLAIPSNNLSSGNVGQFPGKAEGYMNKDASLAPK